jgi:hypothetical protein
MSLPAATLTEFGIWMRHWLKRSRRLYAAVERMRSFYLRLKLILSLKSEEDIDTLFKDDKPY